MRELSDDELIAAGENAVTRLQNLDAAVRRDLQRVSLLFGVPFFAYLAPSIYRAFMELDSGWKAVGALAVVAMVGIVGLRAARARHPVVVALVLATASVSTGVAQSPVTLVVTGENGTSKNFTATELAALPQIEVRSREADSSTVTYRGPSLRELMNQVGAPAGRALRGPAMTLAVLAEAADKYQVAYTLAEIDEQFGTRSVIVALTANGKPLTAQEGPFRIAVAGEEHRARWIRQLTSLTLVRVTRSR